jgi:hypothetical protein
LGTGRQLSREEVRKGWKEARCNWIWSGEVNLSIGIIEEKGWRWWKLGCQWIPMNSNYKSYHKCIAWKEPMYQKCLKRILGYIASRWCSILFNLQLVHRKSVRRTGFQLVLLIYRSFHLPRPIHPNNFSLRRTPDHCVCTVVYPHMSSSLQDTLHEF